MSIIQSHKLKLRLVVVSISFLFSSYSAAAIVGSDPSTSILSQIKQDTGNILSQVNQVPALVNAMASAVTQFAVQWTSPDASKTTAALQSSFVALSNVNAEGLQTQTAIIPILSKEMLDSSSITPTSLPGANDLLFQSVLGQPYYNPDPRGPNVGSLYSYVKNASGVGIAHTVPQLTSWRGTQADQQRYVNYFNTIMAVQSYNGYLMSQMYADNQAQKDGKLNDLQTSLISQASNSNWFALVSSENIGSVLRQILIYNSQVFVLLTQLLQVQKQALSAQAMTNTLLILGNQFTENQMLVKAMQK